MKTIIVLSVLFLSACGVEGAHVAVADDAEPAALCPAPAPFPAGFDPTDGRLLGLCTEELDGSVAVNAQVEGRCVCCGGTCAWSRVCPCDLGDSFCDWYPAPAPFDGCASEP